MNHGPLQPKASVLPMSYAAPLKQVVPFVYTNPKFKVVVSL